MSIKLEWGPDEGRMKWDAAVKLAASKGSGWRLPTVVELVSQYDYDANKPKDAGWTGWYWSSSPRGDYHAWDVLFDGGFVSYGSRSYEFGVRCVREVADISTDRSDESRKRYAAELRALAYRIEKGEVMPTTEVFQKCAGGCGAERQLSSNELVVWNLHGPLKWWCEPCGDRMVDEAAMKPLLDALEKHPHLRAKLREILEIE